MTITNLLSDNVKISERFKSNDSLEVLNVTDKTFQLLYTESGKLHLMNMESFEEVELPASTCENGEKGLQMLEDGMPLSVKYVTSPNDGEKPCSFKLPLKYTYTVESKVQRVKKDAKTASYTTATLTNGAKILVPDFINEGDKILVDLETMKYMRREN
ncbi:hypothetical protein BDF20DRAFT_906311 [Mycotypha africana]|uniref:uncharacterized protein n=1 Tax=Mycotypha africana TaxID=64632 RepID=UPI0022FFCA04|nr:uncharacterized protein BDF20DRAFT_906311 [Mycotypha africana]KAI8977080.1 hypothetical protein BDF20DRAFT_906311 [Mycotypha africana]